MYEHNTPKESERCRAAMMFIARIGDRLELKFGWIYRFPLIWVRTVYLKIKNRSLCSEEGYTRHQIEFFSSKYIGYQTDKFYAVRKRISEYALSNGNRECTKALDVGTGIGFQAAALKNIGIVDVYGIDLVPARIEQAERKHQNTGIKFRVMDSTNLSFPDKYFDFATVSASQHDMPYKVRRKSNSELARVTKDRIVIFEPRTFNNRIISFIYGIIGEILDESQSLKVYVKDDIATILKDNNLEIIKDENTWWQIMNIKVCIHHAS